MTHSPHSTQYHHTDDQDNELTLLIEFSYTPSRIGYLTGLPKDCYPAESAEVEITSITLAEASTDSSRQYSRGFNPFNKFTPVYYIDRALTQLGITDIKPNPTLTPLLTNFLSALNTGGFIGPEQYLVPVDISDLLGKDTLDSIEAACFEEIERMIANQEPPQ